MKSINENNSTQLFLQEQMNKQDKTKPSLYNKKHADHISSYFDMSDTNTITNTHANTKSNPMSIYNNNNLRMGTENSSMGGNETNRNIEETASTCIQTNENINVSNQSLDSFYLERIHLEEIVQNAKLKEMGNTYKHFNNQNNITATTSVINNHKNADTESMKNPLKKKDYSFGANKDSYINAEETEIEIETEAETETETFLNKESMNQQKNGYTKISKNGNHLFHPNMKQNTFESSQQNVSDIYESNMYCNSMKTVPVDTQQSLMNEIIKNNEYKCSEASIIMREETDLETRREYYTDFDRQLEYQSESKEPTHLEKMRTVDADTYNNIYDYIQYHRTEASNKEKDKQEGNCSYEYWTDKYRSNNTMHEMNNTGVKLDDHISEFTDLNIKGMLYQMNNPNYYSSTDEYIDESYKRVDNFSKGIQNSVPTMVYDDASTIIDTKYMITNEEVYEGEETHKTMDSSTESFDDMKNLRTTNAREEIRTYPNQLQQGTINSVTKNRIMNKISNNTINTVNAANPSDLQNTVFMHNADFYRNAPIKTNTNTKKYSDEVNLNMVPMYETMGMQTHSIEMNNMTENMRANNTAPVARYNKYFEQAEQPKYKSGKEYLDSQTNGLYNLKDFKSFMLEPQLYTKMDLDIPEIVDGVTTSHLDGHVTNIKKETVIKYNDTWRLVPGKSFTIDQNGNNNPENEAKLFQEYLDRFNEKTQQMFLNGSFNNLTGNFVMNPSAAFINNQENKNPNKVYNYSDPAVAFPKTYIQPLASTTNENDPAGILDQLVINRMDYTKEYNPAAGGTSQFVPANEFNNIHRFDGLAQLNNITGAHVIEAINGTCTMALINDCNFPSMKQKKETLPLKFISSNNTEQNKNQKPIMKKKLSLCGEHALQYNIKTFLTQTVKNYFTGKQNQLN